MGYAGRFAPSPTGPLHAGSLVAALASYLDARHADGHWGIRIDDIDPPRAVTGAEDAILQSLYDHGLASDAPIDYQSNHSQAYEQALATLDAGGHLFHCRCTRATLGPQGACVIDCASLRLDDSDQPTSLRVSVPPGTQISFTDSILGDQHTDLHDCLTNFIVRRRDGLFAYQLAAAVDDAAPGISHVIRGSDLLPSTARQILLQRLLQLESPIYGHTPVVTDALGNKLSKQTGADALDPAFPRENLLATLAILNQPAPPAQLSTLTDVLQWSAENWDIGRVPR